MVSKTLKTVPAWLDVSDDRKQALEVPANSAVVKRIFEDAAAGIGSYAIAHRLTAERVPTFGPSAKWQPSSINNLIRNRAVLGEFQSCIYNGKKPTPSGPPIPDFYPRVIQDDLFEAAQARRRSDAPHRKGRKGRNIVNIFGTRLHCAYCSSRMKILNSAGFRTLVCSRAHGANGLRTQQFPFALIEDAFLESLSCSFLPPSIIALQVLSTRFPEDPYRWRSQFIAEVEALITIIEVGGPDVVELQREPRPPSAQIAKGVLIVRLPETNFTVQF